MSSYYLYTAGKKSTDAEAEIAKYRVTAHNLHVQMRFSSSRDVGHAAWWHGLEPGGLQEAGMQEAAGFAGLEAAGMQAHARHQVSDGVCVEN